MRIVYVLTSLGVGGAERLVLALARRMAERGHTVAILVLRPRLCEEWSTTLEVNYLNIHKTPTSLLAGIVSARRFLQGFRPHLLHSHSFHANLLARLLTPLTPPCRLVCTIHNVYEGGWMRMLAYRITDGLSQCTTAVSTAAASRYVRLKAVPRDKCIALSNGIELGEFIPNPDRRMQMRKRMSVQNEFVWLAAGRIMPAKDYPNLLCAFAKVRQAHPEAQLWIAGETAGAKLKRSVGFVAGFSVDHGQLDQVRWLGLRRDMPVLLDAADAFVLSSAWEGMPLVVAEAMAMQKPVVATDVGGVRELVGETGLIVPAKSPDDLAQAMLGITRMPAVERHARGLAARKRITEKFSMEFRADAWETLYRRIQ